MSDRSRESPGARGPHQRRPRHADLPFTKVRAQVDIARVASARSLRLRELRDSGAPRILREVVVHPSQEENEREQRRVIARLAASRHRPKRQYHLQRLAALWSEVPRTCFRLRPVWRAEATPDGIALVASFANDPSAGVRCAAVRALGMVRGHRERALPALHAALHDESFPVRITAMRGLARDPRPESRAHFAEALTSSTWTLRWIAAGALAELDPQLDLLPVLRASRPRRITWDWLDAMRKLGGRAQPAINDLRELARELDGGDAYERDMAHFVRWAADEIERTPAG